MVTFNILVAIPISSRKTIVIARPDLNKSDAPLQKTASDQALSAKILGFLRRVDRIRILRTLAIKSIHFHDMCRFTGDIKSFGRAKLHFCCQFVRPYASIKARIIRTLRLKLPIQF